MNTRLIKNRWRGAAAVTLLASLINACQTPHSHQPVDLVLLNARVFTSASPEWAEAIVLSGERISFVGNTTDAQAYVAHAKQVIDLGGRLVLPGINDAHLHPVQGAMKTLYSCNFPFSASLAEVQATVADCVTNSGERLWIDGGQWDSDFFLNNPIESPRTALDKVSGDKAVLLRADSGHDAWLNSKALELAGITEASENPEGGTIVRDASGRPNGLLLEKAAYLAVAKLPAPSHQQYVAGAEELMRIAAEFGVTGMKDASAEEAEIRGLAELAHDGKLTAHMASAINLKDDDWQNDEFQADRLLRIRDQYTGPHLDNRYAKIFLDGVPTSSRTAAMLADYLPSKKDGHRHSGDLHFDLSQLTEMLTSLDAAGFTVKIHAAGDRSVRMALNAIEHTRKTNGNSELRHELAHAGYISPEDIKRFKELNAVADFSPYIWHPSPIMDSVLGAVGPRGEYYWPTRDLLDAGAPILAGSDWPSAVASMNPWHGIEALVTRADPHGVHAGQLWPEQSAGLAEVIRIFTIGGARALRLDDETGSLEVGKLADFIILDKNIFEQASSQISDTRVLATVFGGKPVYTADDSPLKE